jgi:DNA-binding Lrp family transcriptional regulator
VGGFAHAAYLLIQVEVGRSGLAAAEIGKLSGVLTCAPVSGPYDAIALCEGRTLDELSRRTVVAIQHVDGIIRTLTCPVIHL